MSVKAFDKLLVKVTESSGDLPCLICCDTSSVKNALDKVQCELIPDHIYDMMHISYNGRTIIYLETDSSDSPYKVGSKLAERLQKLQLDKLNCVLLLEDEEILQVIEACTLRYPTFDEYKTKDRAKKPKELTFLVDDKSFCEKQLATVNHISQNVLYTRRLVNTPGNHLRPSDMATEAYKLEDLKVKCKVLQGDDIKDMECLTAVGQASSDKSKLIVLEWIPKPDKDVIALVGKAVTFDSGGLSLKTPSRYMETMKGDMAGGATVMGIIRAAAQMKLEHNIVGVIPCAENMVSGNSLRPGDILRSYSGQTVEVLNTDAEGRLILCDALSYVQQKYKPNAVIDFATLTGAIVVALGKTYTGAFSNDDRLYEILEESGLKTWERIWRMPLDPEYDALMDSSIADMKNVADQSAGAGSITAAQFLQRFINPGVRWVHLDIAGTSFTENSPGLFHDKFASGACVRLVLDALPKIDDM